MKKLYNIIFTFFAVILLYSCAEDTENPNIVPPPLIVEQLFDNAILHDSPKIGKVTFKTANHIQGNSYKWSIESAVLDKDDASEIIAEFSKAGEYIVTLNVDDKEYKGTIIIPETSSYENYVVDMGEWHTIIFDKIQKRLFVYGDNSLGQLCIDKAIPSIKEPGILKLSDTVDISSVAAGKNHTLFTDNSYIYACGDNTYGQLGVGDTNQVQKNVTVSTIPQKPNTNKIFVSAGGDISMAGIQFLDGRSPKISLYYFGYNDNASDKVGHTATELITTDSRREVLLATGNNFGVIRATSSYNVYSFGINDKWQLGRIQGAGNGYVAEGKEDENSPNNHPDKNKTDMASGYVFTPYGEEAKWVNYYQNNYFAKLVAGDDFVVSIKKETNEDSHYTKIPKYSLYVWGNNDTNQLGFANKDGKTTVGRATPLFDALQNQPMPTDPNKVTPIQKKMIEVAAGSKTGYAISKDGILYGWGDNSKGKLTKNKQQNNMVYEIPTPQGVTGGYKKVWAGGSRVIALAGDGNLYTWGDNKDGILGTNNQNEKVDLPEKLLFSLKPIEEKNN